MLNCSEGTKTYVYILCHYSTLIWHRYLNSFLKLDKDQHTLHSQYHGFWCPGDIRSQGISSHDIDRMLSVKMSYCLDDGNGIIIEYAICYVSCLVMTSAQICNDVIARSWITYNISTRYGLLLKIYGMGPWCLYLAVRVPRVASSLKNMRIYGHDSNDDLFHMFCEWLLLKHLLTFRFFSPYDYFNVVTSLVQSLHSHSTWEWTHLITMNGLTSQNFLSCIGFCNLLLTKIDHKLGFDFSIDTPMLYIINRCVTGCPL